MAKKVAKKKVAKKKVAKKKVAKKKVAKKKVGFPKYNNTPTSVEFNYIKTPSYRSYHVDGIYGGLTPTKNIYMETFIERHPTPRLVQYAVNDQRIDKDSCIEKEKLSGIVREIEAGIIISKGTAIAIRDWLQNKIEQIENLENNDNEGDN